jgi:hypothetical protein
LRRRESVEAVVYTPHGIQADSLATMISNKPSVETLTFLYGLHDVSTALSEQLKLGAHNALKTQQMLKAKYRVGHVMKSR